MTPKAEKLNKLVDEIPGVCSGGREGIRKLVSELSGEDLTAKPTYRIGDRFTYRSKEYILAVRDTPTTASDGKAKVVAINLATGSRQQGRSYEVTSLYQITEAELRSIFNSRYPIVKISDSAIPPNYNGSFSTRPPF